MKRTLLLFKIALTLNILSLCISIATLTISVMHLLGKL